jgi:hypothetical protein
LVDGRDLDDAFLSTQDEVADLEFRTLVLGGEAVSVDRIVGGEGQGDVGEGIDPRRPGEAGIADLRGEVGALVMPFLEGEAGAVPVPQDGEGEGLLRRADEIGEVLPRIVGDEAFDLADAVEVEEDEFVLVAGELGEEAGDEGRGRDGGVDGGLEGEQRRKVVEFPGAGEAVMEVQASFSRPSQCPMRPCQTANAAMGVTPMAGERRTMPETLGRLSSSIISSP